MLYKHIDLLDGFAHVQTHFDTVFGMIWQGNREARHTVITVTKNFYSHALILLKGKKHKHTQGQLMYNSEHKYLIYQLIRLN